MCMYKLHVYTCRYSRLSACTCVRGDLPYIVNYKEMILIVDVSISYITLTSDVAE